MVKVNKKKCIGCGLCSQICSEVFEIDENGKAQVKKDADKKAKCITNAVEQCPVEAITQ